MIERTGSCPPFWEYVCKRALLPLKPISNELESKVAYGFEWIEIPSYQRGIVWDPELFEDLLFSASSFLGNTVFGKFPLPPGNKHESFLPIQTNDYNVVIDGLQRFSLGTAILSICHPLYLASDPQDNVRSPQFNRLKINVATFAPVYQHNDKALQFYPRAAVCNSYKEFRQSITSWLERELKADSSDRVPKAITRLFLGRQIAPDIYHGFSNPTEAISAFIGLNTIRVQLDVVDWLRSLILDQAFAVSWNADDIEDIENRFSDVFSDGLNPVSTLLPFARITKESLEDENHASNVFPSWNTLFQKSDVERFLNFIDRYKSSLNNPYLGEIRACGTLPWSALIGYDYARHLAGDPLPNYLGGPTNQDDGLRALLCACVRVLIEGNIGRIRPIAEAALRDKLTLQDLAEAMSTRFASTSIHSLVDQDWLRTRLRRVDKKTAPRVFNACLLPIKGTSATFTPQAFGRKTNCYQVDHLIPDSTIQDNQPGGLEARLLMNLVPVRRTTNNSQSNIRCSIKLQTTGPIGDDVQNDSNVHPYLTWLVNSQASFCNQLDRQDLLQSSQQPNIGDARINWLTDRLLTRI